MNKILRKKNENYTIINNVCVRDNRLSLKAKGLMSLIMSLPDDWDFSIQGLASIVKEGKSAIYATITELKDYGYCEVVSNRDDKGKIIGNDYTFFEEPRSKNPYTENPYMENPDMENPDMENPPQINKDIKEIKIETIKKEKEDKSSTKKKPRTTPISQPLDDVSDFIERMYKLYPTKCPLRNTTLGKCSKDKDRIRKLLKTYSMADIEKVFNKEIEEKYGKHYMQNFSTFLNNFPDPQSLFEEGISQETNNPYPQGYWQ